MQTGGKTIRVPVMLLESSRDDECFCRRSHREIHVGSNKAGFLLSAFFQGCHIEGSLCKAIKDQSNKQVFTPRVNGTGPDREALQTVINASAIC